MALSRERIADELLKLLGLPDPAPTVAVMLDRAILRPVLPEIEPDRLRDLDALIANEKKAGIAPDAVRRLASLLPRDEAVGEEIGARLRFSNKSRKRLACAVIADLGPRPEVLAYRIGTDCAVDRLLLAGGTAEAAAIRDWKVPRLPVSGGALIKRGLTEGPIVARTLRTIENRWLDEGFPSGEALQLIVDEALAGAS
jgi:poly(A) polymerase